ncbi:WAT1-related protein At4g15540-like [Momordica charantia]|uniref:WAT1-related protein n=1 Tax=Momordica charantia TaxID=3673 RepID=A0A6J1D8Y3_MOMCH|nr:WAT1-related protein At4g15540-like [Momordica charantia]
MRRGCLEREALPLAAMVAAEFAGVGLTIIFKAASSKGISNYVFIVYTYAIAALCFFPFAFFFFFQRSFHLPYNISSYFMILSLAAIGIGSQLCGYRGLEISSPALSSVISNLTPAFTFIFAVIFRIEKLDWRSSNCVAKIIGTIVSMIGAFVVVLYKGPMLLPNSYKKPLLLHHHSNSDWVLGGFLFSIQYLCYAISSVLMTTKVIKVMGANSFVLLFYYICTTLLSTPICLLAETDFRAWTLPTDMALVAVIYAGMMGQAFYGIIHLWGFREKRPVYVSSFRPLSIVIAAVLAFILLGDALYFGSVIGAIIISIGFYALLWGKAKEAEIKKQIVVVGNLESNPYNEETRPLLQNNNHT